MASETVTIQSRGAGVDCQWNGLRGVLRVKPGKKEGNGQIAKSWALSELNGRD
jgi:hypothetical protein